MGAAGKEPSFSSYTITQRSDRDSVTERPTQRTPNHDCGQQSFGSGERDSSPPNSRSRWPWSCQQPAQPHAGIRPGNTQRCIRAEPTSLSRKSPDYIASSTQLSLAKLSKTHAGRHSRCRMSHDDSPFKIPNRSTWAFCSLSAAFLQRA